MRRVLLLIAAAMALGPVGPAGAGALRVSPVGLDLPAGRAAATLTLRNDDAAPMNVQVRLFRWTQGPDGERYEPATDVVVSPPIAPRAPHSERVVRVVRTGPDVAGREDSYRVIVDELPPPPGTEGREVRLLMRHSIPVFFTPAGSHAPKVAWSAAVDGAAVKLTGVNRGGRRLRVSNLRLVAADGTVLVQRPGLVGYVLAGAEVAWTAPLDVAGAAPARLLADTDAGPLDAPLNSHL